MTVIRPKDEKVLSAILDEIKIAEEEIARGEAIGADELRQLIEDRKQAEYGE
jgi:hypothetical protein